MRTSGSLERVMFSGPQIQKRVKELAREISRDYEGKNPILVGILRGSVFFLADLARALSIPADIDFMAISGYGVTGGGLGVVRITKDLDDSINQRHVLVVEDIIDTGMTINYLTRVLEARRPSSLKVCALLDRRVRRIVDVRLDYVGFEIPDLFLVGYGLDYHQHYRNRSDISVFKLPEP